MYQLLLTRNPEYAKSRLSTGQTSNRPLSYSIHFHSISWNMYNHPIILMHLLRRFFAEDDQMHRRPLAVESAATEPMYLFNFDKLGMQKAATVPEEHSCSPQCKITHGDKLSAHTIDMLQLHWKRSQLPVHVHWLPPLQSWQKLMSPNRQWLVLIGTIDGTRQDCKLSRIGQNCMYLCLCWFFWLVNVYVGYDAYVSLFGMTRGNEKVSKIYSF